MIIGWCLALNGYSMLGCILSVVGTFTIIRKRKLNYWRALAIGAIMYDVLVEILSHTTIPYYFYDLYPFIMCMCFNATFVHEFNYIFKAKALYKILFMNILSFAVFLIILAVLPDDLYTMITKLGIVILISIIFLPYLLSNLVCVVRKLHSYANKKELITINS